MKANTTPRIIGDPSLTRELREHAVLLNLHADGRLAGTSNATTAPPTTGDHAVGDFVRNSAPADSGSIGNKYTLHGWVCVAAGTPGTWVQARYITADLNPAPLALTPGTTVAVDASLSNTFTLTPAQNFTLSNPTGLVNGQVYNFRFQQDGTGSRAVTWGSKYKFAGGVAGVLSTAAGAVDFMSCYYHAATDRLECVLNKGFA